MSRSELQTSLQLKDPEHFRSKYINEALNAGLIELTQPDKPKSSKQKYRLTSFGLRTKRVRRMSLEQAFSLEMKIDVTATKADELYGRGQIQSKFAFKCPEPNCNAQVTCANLDKPKSKRKRDPYFVFVSEHNIDCPLKGVNSYGRSPKYGDKTSDEVYVANSIKLNLVAPASKGIGINSNSDEESDTNNLKEKPNNSGTGKRKQQKSKTLSSMVDAFLASDNFAVETPDGLIELKDLFIEIDNQSIDDFSDEFRIYYGKAWINKNDKGYSVRFCNHLRYKNLDTSPSFFISNDLIDQDIYKKFSHEKLEKIANSKPKQIFLASQLGPYKSYKGEFINFKLEGLEYLDYRVLPAKN